VPTLDWATRDADMAAADRVPYRLLDDVPTLSAGEGDPSGLLVQGDNLEALKALLPFYGGRVRCIYIDPPYNTRSAFEHYDDNLEHAKWLGMIVPRLQLLREFLSEDGSIWVSIDDNEGHYLKVVMDEVFGRRNFVVSNVWQKRYSRENRSAIGDAHEFVLTYCRDTQAFKDGRNKVPFTRQQAEVYKNPNDDPRGRWRLIAMTAQGYRPNQMYSIEGPDGTIHTPPAGRCWSTTEDKFLAMKKAGRIFFGKSGKGAPSVIRYLDEVEGNTPWTWWPHEDVGHTDEAKKEVAILSGGDEPFTTPKPERLLQRILHIATDPGDLVLDSFLGSGTTAAVAHKMGRRWIGIEMGDQARTHAAARMVKVIDGEQGGISKDVGWQGGGTFRFATLGAEAFDGSGRINPDVTWPDLAAHVWFAETRSARTEHGTQNAGPLIGVHEGGAVALLWNGVLKDRSASGGNVLVHPTLRLIREDIARRYPGHDGPLTIYGAATRLSPATLKAERITFKQTPYAVAHRL